MEFRGLFRFTDFTNLEILLSDLSQLVIPDFDYEFMTDDLS